MHPSVFPEDSSPARGAQTVEKAIWGLLRGCRKSLISAGPLNFQTAVTDVIRRAAWSLIRSVISDYTVKRMKSVRISYFARFAARKSLILGSQKSCF